MRARTIPEDVGPLSHETFSAPHFLVGQDGEGHWLAIEIHGLAGGIFRTLTDAIHYAEFETDRRAGAVEIATSPLTLTM